MKLLSGQQTWNDLKKVELILKDYGHHMSHVGVTTSRKGSTEYGLYKRWKNVIPKYTKIVLSSDPSTSCLYLGKGLIKSDKHEQPISLSAWASCNIQKKGNTSGPKGSKVVLFDLKKNRSLLVTVKLLDYVYLEKLIDDPNPLFEWVRDVPDEGVAFSDYQKIVNTSLTSSDTVDNCSSSDSVSPSTPPMIQKIQRVTPPMIQNRHLSSVEPLFDIKTPCPISIVRCPEMFQEEEEEEEDFLEDGPLYVAYGEGSDSKKRASQIHCALNKDQRKHVWHVFHGFEASAKCIICETTLINRDDITSNLCHAVAKAKGGAANKIYNFAIGCSCCNVGYGKNYNLFDQLVIASRERRIPILTRKLMELYLSTELDETYIFKGREDFVRRIYGDNPELGGIKYDKVFRVLQTLDKRLPLPAHMRNPMERMIYLEQKQLELDEAVGKKRKRSMD